MNFNRYYKISFDYEGVEYNFVEDISKNNLFNEIHRVLKENGVEYKDGTSITPRAISVELETAQ